MVAIRRLKPEEASAFRALRIEARRHDPSSFAGTVAQETAKPLDWFAQRLISDPVFGAFLDDELIGMAGYSPAPSPRDGPPGRVWSVYVRPHMRGQRIGEALMSAVIEHARDISTVLHLSVVADNRPARALYERLGFQLTHIDKDAISRLDGLAADEAHYMMNFAAAD